MSRSSETTARATSTGEGSGEATSTGEGSGEATPTDRDRLVASVWPWARDPVSADVEIVVYVVTGDHGGLRVPERFCRECHRFTRAADIAAERVDADVDVDVRSWWTHLPFALRHGGYHAPVMVVDGTRLCQGHDVPTPDEVATAVEEALE